MQRKAYYRIQRYLKNSELELVYFLLFDLLDHFKSDFVLPLSCFEDLDALLFGAVDCCFEELPLGKDLLLCGFLVLVAEVTGSLQVPSLLPPLKIETRE